ncbi:hypothetical protein KAU33_14445 [Candidatus Dependentiae bacterium]|nr:hypothetical protein [Candidatus Dependentiae bacterium]
MVKSINLETEYKVEDEEQVSLSIVIGDAQIGSSIVFLDDNELGRREIENLNIGLGKDIKGQKIIIKSIVKDINDMTNYTSITYILKGGIFDQTFYSKGVVDENGDSIIYRATFFII